MMPNTTKHFLAMLVIFTQLLNLADQL